MSRTTETDPVSETSCFLVPSIPHDGKSPKNPVILTNEFYLNIPYTYKMKYKCSHLSVVN
jgi:hypothetical protein